MAIKKWIVRSVSVLLVAAMLTAFVACNNTDTDLKWDISDDSMANAIELTLALDEESADRTISVTYSQDIFKKDIGTDDIRLTKYYQNYSEDLTDEESYDNYESLENVQLTFVSAKELKLTFNDDSRNVWMYEVVVHKDALSQNVFAIGNCFPTVAIDLDVTPEAEIEGTFTNRTNNPVITINLNGTQANADMTADMVTLSGAFEALDIVSVNAAGNVIRLSTSGNVAQGTSLTGRITLAKEATDCNEVLSASKEVEYRAVYVDETSYCFDSGLLFFDMVSLQDGFTGVDAVSSDKTDVEFVSVSEDKTKITLSVAAATADEGAYALNGSTLTFGGAMFASGNEYKIYVSLSEAAFAASIDYVYVENGVANATAYIYVSDGLLGAIKGSDLAFDGDFVDSTLISLTEQTDGSYIVTFAFTASVEDTDEFQFSGTIAVTSGKVVNIWGTSSDNIVANTSYYSLADRGENLDAIMAFVDANKGVFTTIGTVGGAIGGVASAANGINTILQLVGVVESTDDKLEKINESLENLAGAIAQIDSKLNNMATLIIQNGVDEAERSYMSQRSQAVMAWDQYLTKVTSLNGFIGKYNVNYYRELIDFVNNASEYDLTVYTTEAGEITLPGRIDGYDVEGYRISSVTTMRLGFELDDVKAQIALNKAAYDGIWNDIAAEIERRYTGDSADAQTYIQALKLAIARKAFGNELATDIVNAFRDMCYALAGSALGSPVSAASVTPLDNYYTMLGCYYNFATEAEADMEAMLGWLSGYILKGASLAVFAMTCEDGVTVGDINEVNNAYETALNEISDQAIRLKNKSGKIWSFIAGNTLKTSELELKYYNQDTLGVYYKTGRNDFVAYNFGSALTQTNLEVMRNRWSRLHEAGIVGAATFVDYLAGVGLITENQKNAYVMVETAYKADLPTDNSVSLPVSSIWKSDWFTLGKTYSIGTNGKYSAKYFDEKSQLLGKAYKLSDGSTVTRLGAMARYCEIHWYWFNHNEWVYFLYSIANAQPFIVFEIGK